MSLRTLVPRSGRPHRRSSAVDGIALNGFVLCSRCRSGRGPPPAPTGSWTGHRSIGLPHERSAPMNLRGGMVSTQPGGVVVTADQTTTTRQRVRGCAAFRLEDILCSVRLAGTRRAGRRCGDLRAERSRSYTIRVGGGRERPQSFSLSHVATAGGARRPVGRTGSTVRGSERGAPPDGCPRCFLVSPGVLAGTHEGRQPQVNRSLEAGLGIQFRLSGKRFGVSRKFVV